MSFKQKQGTTFSIIISRSKPCKRPRFWLFTWIGVELNILANWFLGENSNTYFVRGGGYPIGSKHTETIEIEMTDESF